VTKRSRQDVVNRIWLLGGIAALVAIVVYIGLNINTRESPSGVPPSTAASPVVSDLKVVNNVFEGRESGFPLLTAALVREHQTMTWPQDESRLR
jgi:hypothetical protein